MKHLAQVLTVLVPGNAAGVSFADRLSGTCRVDVVASTAEESASGVESSGGGCPAAKVTSEECGVVKMEDAWWPAERRPRGGSRRAEVAQSPCSHECGGGVIVAARSAAVKMGGVSDSKVLCCARDARS